MPDNVEVVVRCPIINPDTGRSSRRYEFAGVVDVIEDSKIVDWKSCSNIDTFVREKKIGFQPYLYALAAQSAGYRIDEIEYRLIETPSIRFCGKDKWDIAAYEDRCFEWLHATPNHLMTYSIMINSARMQQTKVFLWDCAKRLLENYAKDRWLPNEHACHKWQRVCEYAPLCEAMVDGLDVDWIIKDSFEKRESHLKEIESDRKFITYTSLSTLTLCEMKYFWRYVHNLTPRTDYHEARWLGSAMHRGLEAYAQGGAQAAKLAIYAWERENPALGEGTKYVDQQCAKARAMVRAAAAKWPHEGAKDVS